jgi:hypothetical protein
MSIDAIRQSIHEAANESGEGLHRAEAVFRTLAGIVTDAGFLTNPQWAPLRFRQGRLACSLEGYDIDEEDGIMTVFAVIDSHADTELDRTWAEVTCAKKDLDQAVKEMLAAVSAIADGAKLDLEESDSAREMVKSLTTDYRPDKGRVTCCVLTTGRVTSQGATAAAGSMLRTAVWDADRLINTRDNGREQLVADFTRLGGLPCLVSDREAGDIQEGRLGVLLTKVPGNFLADLYNEHRMRLLERNVRAFLQFTGKVNKGIRDTIHRKAEYFLSFNNGISVTASKVTLQKSPDGNYRLMSAEDFQIVNGGQTTASIARCAREDGIDVAVIGVAMKLTVVPENLIEDLVPKISRFANMQNRIQEADFFANNPWHIELERHSRAIEAERDADSGGRPIRWYYERVRGQYAEELAKLTPAQKLAFKNRHPSRTRFVKTDLARYLLAWEQEAHSVSLGGQKCFARLMAVLGATSTNADSSQLPAEEDFRRICCLALLQRHGEAVCRELGIVGYRANLVAYAIMLVSVRTTKRLPWRRIWNAQGVTPELDQALRVAIPACDLAIRKSAGARNVTEWAKRTECREFVLAQGIVLDLEPAADWDQFSIKDMARPKAEADLIKVFFKLSPDDWRKVAAACRRDGRNPVWIGVAETAAAKLIPAGKSPSEKQAKIMRKTLLRYVDLPPVRAVLDDADRKLLAGEQA